MIKTMFEDMKILKIKKLSKIKCFWDGNLAKPPSAVCLRVELEKLHGIKKRKEKKIRSKSYMNAEGVHDML